MKINVVPIQKTENGMAVSANSPFEPEGVMLSVSGEPDSSNAVLQKARKLIEENGSDTMVESFDWAVQNSVFFSEK